MAPTNEQAVEAIRDEIARGARRIRLREVTGMGAGRSASAVLAEEARAGRCLVLCHPALMAQAREDLLAASPDLHVGAWGSGARVEFASFHGADRRAGEAREDAFSWILLHECHESTRPAAVRAVGRFPGAGVVEVCMMPHPHPGTLPDVDVDMHRLPSPAHRLDAPDEALASPSP